ncbi:putative bifunctional diguanylate cyclase/phosphodiesterase [Actinoplanes sp. HUAS TT8]|uniref:putative bifunctional diguanylate cyclase/phosphodiesterase n=1 Tax=Actinoplanes sp. HUAS TT8 TaxID=3447453 RepID=UPI003F527E50
MSAQWSVHHLTEYLSEVGAQQDEATAVRVAAERAAEALDAEIGAVAMGGTLVAAFGFGRTVPPPGLFDVAQAAGSVDLPRMGAVEVRCADLGRHVDGRLLVGRAGDALSAEEQQMLHGMARMLGLALRGIRMLEAERQLSRQRLQLLDEADARHRLLAAARDALHDPLTGLANRALFADLLERACASGGGAVVLYLDLDGFKAVNDNLGHQAGDELLTVVAARLSACLRPGDTAARLGGDEFAVLLDGADTATGMAVADRIVASVHAPIDLNGRPAVVGASIGIAVASPSEAGAASPSPAARLGSGSSSAAGAASLLDAADIAMYQAKRAGKGRAVVFEWAMRAAIEEREALREELRQAVLDEEFTVHYQPVIHLGSGATVAVEALPRWISNVRGPVEFIPLAEEAGVIRELGNRVLTTSARAVMRWRVINPGLGLHVNVSARQVEAASFPDDVTAILSRTGLPAHALTLELTEDALTGDPERVHAHLAVLRRCGVRVAVDDFGTGLTSLAHLQRFAVDEVKIAARAAGASTEELAMIRAVIAVGQVLDIAVVGEDIETPDQVAALQQLGCHYGQGFHLAAPLPYDELDDAIRATAGAYRSAAA